MDIMELGAIGELVGGIAVIGSLIFVGLQVRQSNEMAKAEVMRAYIHAYNDQILSPIADPDRVQLYRDGLNNFDALDRNSQAAFHSQLVKIFLLGQTNFLLQRQGMVPEAMTHGVQRMDASMIKIPALAHWWELTRGVLVPEYVDHLEGLRDSLGDPAMIDALPWYGPDEPSSAEDA